MTRSPATVFVLAFLLGTCAAVSAHARGRGSVLDIAVDQARGRTPGARVTVAPGRWRLTASLRSGHASGIRLIAPGTGGLESWSVGQLVIHWGNGAAGLPRAAPGFGAALATGGRQAVRGCAATLRIPKGRVLLVAGERARSRPSAGTGAAPGREATAMVAWTHRGIGALLGAEESAPLSWSLYASSRQDRGRWDLEVARSEARTGVGARATLESAGTEATVDFHFRAADPTSAQGAARRGDTELELRLRRTVCGLPAAIGTRAELDDTRRARVGVIGADGPRTARLWADVALPADHGRVVAALRAELRRSGDQDRSRVTTSIRTPLAGAMTTWTAGGGLLMNLRCRWHLPAALTLEAGAATWNGSLTGTGATVDVPRVPGHGLDARLTTPGQAATFLMDWQVAQLRVRLGLATRRSANAAPDIEVASRVDMAWPLSDD